MWTTVFVVAIRPLQLLLACLALICASLDQLYLDASQSRLYILLLLILPATLATISVSVWTSLIYKQRNETKHLHLILRWITDFVIAAVNVAAVVLTFVVESRQGETYREQPPVPFQIVFVVCLSVNASLFMATAFVLILEHFLARQQRQRDVEDLPVIVHTSHEEASPLHRFAKKSDDSLATRYTFGNNYDNPYRLRMQ